MNAHRFLATLCVLVAFSTTLPAQTSGTLSTQTASNWTTAPWVITAGPGTYPDGGGVATWNAAINNVIGTAAGTTTITLDTPITLSGITYNSPFSMTLAGSATNNLGLSSSGATFNVQLSIANTPTLFQLANNTTAPITGGGSAGLTKIGNGTMTLGATVASTYTGGTHINAGILVISATAAIGDSVLGAAGAGNGLSMDGGALFNNITSGWTTSRDIALGAGGGTIYCNTAATVNGVISGPGAFNYYGFAAAGVLTLTNTNTYTGATTTSQAAVGTLTLSGNGSITSSSSYDFAGTVNLNSSTINNNNRLNDAAAIAMRGATVTLTGNSGAATNENIGAVTLANGASTITVTPNAAQAASINAASFTRQGNSTLFVRGTSLGATAGAGVAQVTSGVAPALVGGGGAAGSTNISIIPWAAGNTSATATTLSSFVTYGATGFRPLASGEYATAFGTATDNVRLVVTTAVGGGVTANSLLFAPGAAATLSGGPINLTSGAFLYSPASTATGTVNAGLSFGSAEGIISTSNTLNIGGVLDGTGGLTINPFAGSTVTLTGANTYTGATTLLAGTTQYSGTITNDGTASAFGAGTSAASPIIFNPGTGTTRLWATAASTINRDISVRGTGPGTADLGTSGTTYIVTVNGNIDLQRVLALDAGTTATAAMILNGVVSGAGSLTDLSSSFNILNGNNTYSGGTNIQTGTYALGSDSTATTGPLGTGTVYFSSTGFMQSKDATAHTISNPFFLGSTPTFQGTGALTLTGDVNLNGARTVGVTNTAAAGLTLTGTVSNGALTKTGTGVMGLDHTTGNTYTGGTILGTSAGILNVNNSSGSGTGSGTVSIGGTTTGNRSTLSGNFTIAGATQDSGVLSPGNGATLNGVGDIGTANFGSSLTLTSNTLVTLELSGMASFDKISVSGLLTLGGSFVVTTISGFVAQAGNVFDLVDWGSVAGTATIDVSGAATAAGTSWDTSTFLTDGTIRVIPEPSIAIYIASGIGFLGVFMRRRFR